MSASRFCCFSRRTGALGAQEASRVPNLVGPRSPDNFMGRFVGPTALQDTVILTFNRCSAPTMRNWVNYRCKILEGGTKRKNKFQILDMRQASPIIFIIKENKLSLQKTWKTKWFRSKSPNQPGPIVHLELYKNMKVKQSLYRHEQVLRALGG